MRPGFLLLFILFSQTAAGAPSPSKFLNAIGAALMNQPLQREAVLPDLDKALFESIGADDLAEAQRLVAKGADIQAKNWMGWTPLHHASLRNLEDMADFLISQGADVNAADYFLWTPLHHASSNGLKSIIKLLLAKGGNLNAKNMIGKTPYDLAKNKEIKDLLYSAAQDKKNPCQSTFSLI